jgi:leucyl-tRNA synthetase
MEALKYNTAIAALMKYLNDLEEQRSGGQRPLVDAPAARPQQDVTPAEVRTLLLLLAPFAPFITEELWSRLGEADSIHTQRWPEADPAALWDEVVTLVVQVNGRLRDRIAVPADLEAEEIERRALAQANVQRFVAGHPVRQVIHVPGRLVNVVTG